MCFAQSIEVEDEDVVWLVPTGDAPTTSDFLLENGSVKTRMLLI